MKNNAWKILMIPLMLVLTLSLVQAALLVNVVTDEFSIESPLPVRNVKACECGMRTEIIEVTNLGDFKTLFNAEIFSPLADQISLSRTSFSLAPGEKTRIHAYINAPCDTSISSFYMVKVSTNYGRSKELYKEFTSQRCQNIKFTSNMLNETIYPGETAQIEIELQNVAEFEDTFKIMPTANVPFAYMSRDTVTLEPDEKTKVILFTKLPVSVYGQINQPFVINSEKGRNSAEGFESYEIIKDYDYAIKTEEFEINVCEDVTSKKIISFENLAGTANEYYLSIKAPYFVNLSQDALSLNAYENDSITMNIAPSQHDIGEYEVVLSAQSKYGEMAKEKYFKIKVNDCYGSEAGFEDGASTATDKACCGEKEYEFTLTNRGTYEEVYQLSVDSEGWVSLDESDEYVRLRPSQSAVVKVKAELPCTDSEKISFITIKQLKAPYQTHELRLDLESLSERSCYNVELLQQSYAINYESNSIPLLLKHTGLKGGVYDLELGELQSKFISLEENETKFEPGEMKVIHVTLDNQSGYEAGTYLNKLSLTITPEDKDIDYDRQFWIVLKDKSFLAKVWEYITNFNYTRIGVCGLASLVLLAILICTSALVVYLRTDKDLKIKRIKASQIKKLRMLNIALVALLLAGLLLLVLLGSPDESRFYESASNETSPLFHEWKQSTAYKIDVDQYFTDPDLDILSYTASQPNHIQVRIDNGFATLTPEHGWSGTEHIVFTANDNKGGMTDSDVMTLSVIKKRPMSFMDFWNLYCKQVNITLLMLILLTCLMITDVVEEKGYKRYLPNRRK
ncbi:hypothetical protein JW826_02150 [Candidatus Woesearchaeota archaeon]|nr:hypothetical protein [Candidatus Woesearchaeota archaeon]